MRVLMVTTSFPRWAGDSAGHFVASLAESVAAAGHEVTVLAPHEKGVPENEIIGNVRIERFRYLPPRLERVAYGSGIVENLRRRPLTLLAVPFFALAMRRRVRQLANRCDVVHIHWAPTAVLAGTERIGAPCVIKLHGSDVTLARRGGLWRRLLAHGLHSASGCDVVAAEQQEFLLREGFWSPSRPLAVIPSGVPDELLDRESSPGSGRIRFVFVGRLIAAKGVNELIEAFGSVVGSGIDAELEIVGTGPLSGELATRVRAGGIVSRLTLSGQLDHDRAIDAIARADALVLPSYGEGSPLVVTEALALGTPVIGSRVGAIPDLLGIDGLVVEPGNVGELVGAMTRIATDAALRDRLAMEGRDRARREFRWDGVARATVDLYADAIRTAGPADEGDRSAKDSLFVRLRQSVTGRVARLILLAALLYYIVRALSAPIALVDFAALRINVPVLLASVVLLGVYYAMFTGGLTMLYRLNGSQVPYRDVFKMSFVANLGKYLPGGFWPVAARVAMASRIRIRRRTTVQLSVTESAVSVTAACLVILAAGILGSSPQALPSWSLWAAGALAGTLLVGIHPSVLSLSSRLLERLTGARVEPLPMGYIGILSLVGYYALTWLVAGAAFRTFVSAFAPAGADWLAYSAYFAFGAVVGLLVLFAPGGIGAREGAFLIALTGPLGAPMAALVSVVARLWSTIVELVLSAVAALIPYSESRTADRHTGPPAEETGP